MRGQAIRGLAAYADANTPKTILGVYAELTPAERRDALQTLASRPAYGKALLEALAAKKIEAKDVSADLIRQLRTLKDKELDKRIAEVWGVVRATPADRLRQQATYKRMLQSIPEIPPDLALGRALYVKTCAQCHTLFGAGAKIGPELTGSNRANLDYLLENMIDPSAVIPKEYAVTLFELNSGRFVTGILKEETPAAFNVVTANETLTIPRKEVTSRQLTQQSMMPEDQLKPMSEHDVRSLVAYLQSQAHVPLLDTPATAKDFFNGKDLTGWIAAPRSGRSKMARSWGRPAVSARTPSSPARFRRKISNFRCKSSWSRTRRTAAFSSVAFPWRTVKCAAPKPTSARVGGASFMRRAPAV